ncbi:MAG: DUF4399 domain-containing protein, partial [Actinomycetota bacterium]
MSRRLLPIAIASAGLLLLAACSNALADNPRVFFGEPKHGAVVTSPVFIAMEAENFTIEPAARGVHEGAGHFHLMVDTPCVPFGMTVPADENHLHFGNGTDVWSLILEPGEHSLCLQAGDAAH